MVSGTPRSAATRFGDKALWDLLEAEFRRQNESLALVASASVAPWQVLVCEGSLLTNVTGEGYPGARYHSGCETFDDVERLAVERACQVFDASFANVQPHSGTNANTAALSALLEPGGRVLSMSLSAGGHLSHGAKASQTAKYYTVAHYGVDTDGLIDFEGVERAARRFSPDVIICGGSSYPRAIDFARFRAIADDVGAYLLADVSHIAGLVATGLHASPVPSAHVTTTSTYKQLAGPRGGLILGGRDVPDPAGLATRVARSVFPGTQGTPAANQVAAKAWALGYVTSPEFAAVCSRIVAAAQAMAQRLSERGLTIVAGGTDTHMVVVDLRSRGLSGDVVERVLESVGLLVNRNSVPEDPLPARISSGIRLGTNSLVARGGGPPEAVAAADLAGVSGLLRSWCRKVLRCLGFGLDGCVT